MVVGNSRREKDCHTGQLGRWKTCHSDTRRKKCHSEGTAVYKKPSSRSMKPVHLFMFPGTEGEGGQLSVNVWIFQSESKVGK